MIYFGGLTFSSQDPANYLKIPNKIAAKRIAEAVLKKYGLRDSLHAALGFLYRDGEIGQVLSCYRDLMLQRDVTTGDLTKKTEEIHRDSFHFSLLQNHLHPRVEFPVIKVICYLFVSYTISDDQCPSQAKAPAVSIFYFSFPDG